MSSSSVDIVSGDGFSPYVGAVPSAPQSRTTSPTSQASFDFKVMLIRAKNLWSDERYGDNTRVQIQLQVLDSEGKAIAAHFKYGSSVKTGPHPEWGESVLLKHLPLKPCQLEFLFQVILPPSGSDSDTQQVNTTQSVGQVVIPSSVLDRFQTVSPLVYSQYHYVDLSHAELKLKTSQQPVFLFVISPPYARLRNLTTQQTSPPLPVLPPASKDTSTTTSRSSSPRQQAVAVTGISPAVDVIQPAAPVVPDRKAKAEESKEKRPSSSKPADSVAVTSSAASPTASVISQPEKLQQPIIHPQPVSPAPAPVSIPGAPAAAQAPASAEAAVPAEAKPAAAVSRWSLANLLGSAAPVNTSAAANAPAAAPGANAAPKAVPSDSVQLAKPAPTQPVAVSPDAIKAALPVPAAGPASAIVGDQFAKTSTDNQAEAVAKTSSSSPPVVQRVPSGGGPIPPKKPIMILPDSAATATATTTTPVKTPVAPIEPVAPTSRPVPELPVKGKPAETREVPSTNATAAAVSASSSSTTTPNGKPESLNAADRFATPKKSVTVVSTADETPVAEHKEVVSEVKGEPIPEFLHVASIDVAMMSSLPPHPHPPPAAEQTDTALSSSSSASSSLSAATTTTTTAAGAISPTPYSSTDIPSSNAEDLERERTLSLEDKQKRDQLRERARGEFLQTERTYFVHLGTLIKEFVVPLKTAVHTNTLPLTEETLAKIINNLETLYNFHLSFLADLEQNNQYVTSISSTVLKYAQFFKIYIAYLNGYQDSLSTINALRQQKRFAEFLATVRSRMEEISILDLTSYLIMPVQRVPRYVLLLSEIRRHTGPLHPEYYQLIDALESIKNVALYVNESKRHVEQISKLVDIADRVSGDVPTLVQPSRRWIREATLERISINVWGVDRVKPAIFFLFNDLLLWCSADHRYKGSIELVTANMDLRRRDQLLMDVNSARSNVTIKFPSIQVLLTWAEDIGRLIDELQVERDKARVMLRDVRNRRRANGTESGAASPASNVSPAHMRDESSGGFFPGSGVQTPMATLSLNPQSPDHSRVHSLITDKFKTLNAQNATPGTGTTEQQSNVSTTPQSSHPYIARRTSSNTPSHHATMSANGFAGMLEGAAANDPALSLSPSAAPPTLGSLNNGRGSWSKERQEAELRAMRAEAARATLLPPASSVSNRCTCPDREEGRKNAEMRGVSLIEGTEEASESKRKCPIHQLPQA